MILYIDHVLLSLSLAYLLYSRTECGAFMVFMVNMQYLFLAKMHIVLVSGLYYSMCRVMGARSINVNSIVIW